MQEKTKGQTIKGTVVLQRLLKSKAKIKSLRGGSRSSKTWSVIQNIGLLCQDDNPYAFTIARAKLTWLKSTVLKDFEKIIYGLGWPIYPAINPRRTEQEYNLLNNEIAFIGADEEKKLFGRSQDYYWLNEATEMTKHHHDQIEMRTSIGGWLDYNPVGDNLWLYDVEDREDVDMIHSTVLDNPFAPEEIVKKIRSYEPTPENIARGTADAYMWDVYGLGKIAKLEGLIYKEVNIVDEMPSELKKRGYGLDFGFTNDPSALIECGVNGEGIWMDEVIYETGMTNRDLYNAAADRGVNFRDPCVADSAEPKSIEELSRMGWRGIKGATKGRDSINQGIQLIKQHTLNVTRRSVGLRKELNQYKWATDRAGVSLNKPVDKFNHGLDAGRYWGLDNLQETKIRPAKISFRGR